MSPRIAVACSGLGHVHRGIEAWAADLGQALRRAGADVTLFAGARFEGATALPCLRRTGRITNSIASVTHHLGGWRYGMSNAGEVEQTSFAFALWRHVRRDFDVVHVQDPAIARWLEVAHRRGLSRPRVIYANGTGEAAPTVRRFAYLQQLTPQAQQEWESEKPAGQLVFMIPNFIDTTRFVPGDAAAARAALGLPPNALIVLCCAAIRRYHKRIDYLLTEFAAAAAGAGREMILVVAGGHETDSDELIAMGRQLLGDRVRFLTNLPRDVMPTVYQAADLFVLTSLFEMFGIVLIEAMATGLPLICHDTPAFRYVAGPAAIYADLRPAGALAGALHSALADGRLAALAQAARPHVLEHFAEPIVISQIIAMYQAVLADREAVPTK